MRKNCILSIFFLLTSTVILSQPITWQRAYKEPHHNNDDESYCMCPADGQNIYVAGLTSDPRAGFVLKLNQYGDTLWYKYYNYEQFIYGICGTAEGGCIFGGDGATITRIDPSGNSIWQKSLDSLAIYDLCSRPDSTYLFSSYSYRYPFYAYLGKIRYDGTVLWLKSDTSLSRVIFKKIQMHPSDGFVCAGTNTIASGASTVLARFDDSGNMLWKKTYQVGNSYRTTSMILLSDFIVIACFDPGTSPAYAHLLKITLSGDLVSSVNFLSSIFSFQGPLLSASANRLYFSFLIDTSISVNTTRIVMCDSMLTVKKQITIVPKGDYLQLSAMMFAPNSSYGEINLTGTTNLAVNSGSGSTYVARIDSSLNVLPPPIAINQISTIIPKKYKLHANYPNPFNPQTRIVFEISNESDVKLTVFDVLGREMIVLVEGKMKAGTYEAVFDGTDLTSGLYFCELRAGDYKETRKMILLK